MNETLYGISLRGVTKDLFARVKQPEPDATVVEDVAELQKEKLDDCVWAGIDGRCVPLVYCLTARAGLPPPVVTASPGLLCST